MLTAKVRRSHGGPPCPLRGSRTRGGTTSNGPKASRRDDTWTNHWSEPEQPRRRPAVRGKTGTAAARPTTPSGPGDTEHSWQHAVRGREVDKRHVGSNVSTVTAQIWVQQVCTGRPGCQQLAVRDDVRRKLGKAPRECR